MRKELQSLPYEYSHIKIDYGWGQGYVLVPPNHPAYTIDAEYIDVHGGITWDHVITKQDIKYQMDLHPDDLHHRMLGFDTAHYEDNMLRWPKEQVLKETERLRDQLIKYKTKD